MTRFACSGIAAAAFAFVLAAGPAVPALADPAGLSALELTVARQQKEIKELRRIISTVTRDPALLVYPEAAPQAGDLWDRMERLESMVSTVDRRTSTAPTIGSDSLPEQIQRVKTDLATLRQDFDRSQRERASHQQSASGDTAGMARDIKAVRDEVGRLQRGVDEVRRDLDRQPRQTVSAETGTLTRDLKSVQDEVGRLHRSLDELKREQDRQQRSLGTNDVGRLSDQVREVRDKLSRLERAIDDQQRNGRDTERKVDDLKRTVDRCSCR